MITILNTKEITLEWQVLKNPGATAEDFSRAHLVVLAVGGRYGQAGDVWRLTVSDVSGGKIVAAMPTGMPVGVYDLKAIWAKNEAAARPFGGVRPPVRPSDVLNWQLDARCLMCSYVNAAFALTDVSAEETLPQQANPTLSVSSYAASYGYDGLSAFETAVMRGATTATSESEWLLIRQTEIEDGGIVTAKLADGAVTTAKIADTAVTTGKIADNAVTEAKIADDSVGMDKLTAEVRGELSTSHLQAHDVTWDTLATAVQERIEANDLTETQYYSDTEKATARANIDALTEADLVHKLAVVPFDGIQDLSSVAVSPVTAVDVDSVFYDNGAKRFLAKKTEDGVTTYYSEWYSSGDTSVSAGTLLEDFTMGYTYFQIVDGAVYIRGKVVFYNRDNGYFYKWNGTSMVIAAGGSGSSSSNAILLPSMVFDPTTGELVVSDEDVSRFSFDESTGELVLNND